MLFKLEQEERFDEFWAMYPRRVGRGAAQKKFTKALTRDSIKNIMTGLTAMVETCRATEKRFIPHAATWLHQDRWLDEIETEQEIPNPHPELDKFCQMINEKLVKSQRAKGNWSRIDEITDGKLSIDSWLKTTTLGGWDKCLVITDFLAAMKAGTIVTNFAHWEKHFK